MTEENLPNNLTKGDQLGMVINEFQKGVDTTIEPKDVPARPTEADIDAFIENNRANLNLLTPDDIIGLKEQILLDYDVNAPKAAPTE